MVKNNKMPDEYNQDVVDMLMRGERPEDMDFEKFKSMRRFVKNLTKTYLKGELFHISSELIPIKGTKYSKRVTKTYKKNDTAKVL